MEREPPNYYALIPANVRYDSELKANEKLLYAEITALSNKNGYCHAGNKYFSELYGVSTTSISKWVSSLVERGYLKRVINYKEGTKEILNRYLTIVNDPIEEKLNTPLKKTSIPIEEKLKDNNTSSNSTRVNNTSTNNTTVVVEEPTDVQIAYAEDLGIEVTNQNRKELAKEITEAKNKQETKEKPETKVKRNWTY